MAQPFFDASEPTAGPYADLLADPDEFGQILGPIIAGARARGVADALELLGVAGVLLDRSGRVLHASGLAVRALSPLVEIIGDHLVGSNFGVNEGLQKVVGFAMSGGSHAIEVPFFAESGELRFRLKTVGVPQDGTSSVQLLQAILVIFGARE